ncbi:MAG: hypothetical protein AAB678_01875 [Patescibacteria group bacterium]
MCSKHLLASAHQDMAILYREIARVIQFACKEREDAEARRAQK